MSEAGKVVDLEEAARAVERLHAEGRTVVQCHGVFDLLHIGHIRHLTRAKSCGDALVVTVTPDRFVSKGPHRPAFTEDLRAEAVAALDCVDLVAINRWPTAVETIATLRPDLYAKGSEYSDEGKDVTGGIAKEREAVESIGGRVIFTDELTFSSSHLLNEHMSLLTPKAREFVAGFSAAHSRDEIVGYFDRIRDLKVLVVGETIIDEYQYCDSIGKSSKAPALVAKVGNMERFAGGIVAVANHVAGFCDDVTVLTQLGRVNSHEEFVRGELVGRVRPSFLYRRDAPTIVKRRFIESYFFSPMFELYEINDEALDPADDAELCDALRAQLPNYDVVIVVDYGHSMITTAAADILCEGSKFLAMNAQANAGNRGYHRLSKYKRADYVCAAEHEIYLEAHDWRGDLRPVLSDVAERLSCPRVLVTLGSRGSLCACDGKEFVEVPALATKVVDRVGAGDAFLSVTAPLVASGAPMDVVAFVGNVAGAQAVATVGHRSHLERPELLKHIQALLA